MLTRPVSRPSITCEAVSLFAADEVGPGHADVIEDQLVRVDRAVPELVDVLRNAEAVRLRNEQTRHPAMRRFDVRVRFHDRGEDRSVLAVRDEHLAAPDDVFAVRALRDRADGLEVAPTVRLGQREAAAAQDQVVPKLRRDDIAVAARGLGPCGAGPGRSVERRLVHRSL